MLPLCRFLSFLAPTTVAKTKSNHKSRRQLRLETLEPRRLLAGASVSGNVFGDANADASLNGNEAGISGRVVFLDANSNKTLDQGEDSTTTDSSGNFTLQN